MSALTKPPSTQLKGTGLALDLDSSRKLQMFDIVQEDKRFIAMYFRYRLSSFIKIAEEKIKMNAVLYKGNSATKKKHDKLSEQVSPGFGAPPTDRFNVNFTL